MWSELLFRLRALLRRRAVEREMDDELRFHLEQHVRKFQEAGLTPKESMRRALLAFGGVTQAQEGYREERGVSALDDLWQDLAYAVRVLRKSPGFAAIALATLALGIGANTTAFSFVNAILLKKLPVERPGELAILRYSTDGRGPYTNFRYPDFRELEQRNTVFAGVLGRTPMYFHVTLDTGATRVYGELVSSGYFQTLGVRAALGRTLTAEDNGAEDAHPVCVITWRLWQERFGGDPGVMERTISLDAHPFQIVGVLQPGFRGTELQSRRDVFVPMSMTRMFMGMKRDDPGWAWFHVMRV